ncbi:pyrophosphatase PpaX [Clostridium cavendishii DSM 21758]|uniref:Pyrophosphatase PpaX n=1 Tax=Clostridium cavendishii DSM 21758 TaxID=1121302 RepID=A0A1M6T512_9CLOT|nr:pyrophosphatase PpaX [Clostridium cavendishii]SHK52073.1 pyrophosphatase PpaX [Clostridium cavendishii DSM 21758]
MIKAVLFDLDGTLIDTNELIFNSFDYALRTVLNLNPSKDEITQLFGKPLRGSLAQFNEEKADELVTTYRRYNEERHDTMCKPFEGVKELLDGLKDRGIKLGIVTSKRKVLAERGLVLGGLLEYFDVFFTPESTKNHKPHGEPAEKACESLNVKPEEAIMVGDSNFDLLCGKNAGTKTCGVTYTALPISVLEEVKPDYFIDKAIELLEIVDKENEAVA